MGLCASFSKKVFNFNFNARTSRGSMDSKVSWFVKIWDESMPQLYGVGECGPLPGLSIDYRPDFEEVLSYVIEKISGLSDDFLSLKASIPDVRHLVPVGFPSITFGLETALLDFMRGGKRIIFENGFIEGEAIPINGLVWMGDMDFMMDQLRKKIDDGFTCVKLKVGGLDFNLECDLIRYIRTRYAKEDLTIRLDANGAFHIDDVMTKLGELAKYNIDSIEQPIKPGLAAMGKVCKESPIPIAFDEELIGYDQTDAKISLLTKLKPQFIILKPSLHGGFSGCAEWIEVAEHLGIGWWITSALESNIGLNAICQFTANYAVRIPQGLGTGTIYENNISSPLRVEKGKIFQDTLLKWSVNV